MLSGMLFWDGWVVFGGLVCWFCNHWLSECFVWYLLLPDGESGGGVPEDILVVTNLHICGGRWGK